MPINLHACRELLDKFKLDDLFIEHLGWDRHNATLTTTVDGHEYALSAIAHKRGFTVFVCEPGPGGRIPDHPTRGRIDTYVTKSAREHIIVYTNRDRSEQLWQWVRRAPGQPIARREYPYRRGQTGGMLIERVLPNITFALTEEDGLSIVDVTTRAKAGFDVEKVTKRFYDRFKTEHEAFCKFLKGIPDASLQSWYVSVMLNRLMFIYFIQKKGFLDRDADYLKNRLGVVRKKGKDRYYREFLCPLFFEGFAKRPNERSAAARTLLGTVPYLNGGLFLKHQIEVQHGRTIQIPDAAFERLFEFFDGYRWHLDERPLRANNEINPDVLGYIFEKYINQKQMGAYYTKEDITEYISKSTIIPFLFDAARKDCTIAFKPDGAVWRLLKDDPDRYIYDAVRRGVIDKDGSVIPESVLPGFVQKGMHDPKARMFDKPYNLGEAEIPDPDGRNLALPTETWREYTHRRTRCLEIREKLRMGEVHEINDLITLNLDIRQFAEDVIATSEGPELVRAFWKAIQSVTVLDPTCGSGAFLFAALNILEPLYEACVNRMEGFVEELRRSGKRAGPKKFADFRQVLDRIAAHPNHRYFVLKSIMVNNLFGVDIMEEATEICKLRLFLKLVAQIERFDDIEPLPDIDFNIRAGNTLVGYTSLDEIKNALAEQRPLGFSEDKKVLDEIEEQARLVDTAFRKFREMQTDQGVTPTELAKGKEMVRSRMSALDAELDRYLAAEYGISPHTITNKKKYEAAFQKWRKSHQPFHWFVHFYGIMSAGGFDAIIGNPPYVEYARIRRTYSIRGYRTERCGNLYAYAVERCHELAHNHSSFGMIVPLSIATTERMAPLQQLLLSKQHLVWLSHFDVYPSKLFEGAKQRLTIVITRCISQATQVFTTRYNRWKPEERSALIKLLTYGQAQYDASLCSFPKVDDPLALGILRKLSGSRAATFVNSDQQVSFYVHRIPYNYIKAVDFVPYFWNEIDGRKKSEDYKPYLVTPKGYAKAFLAMVNSNLFFWWWYSMFEGYHCGKHEVHAFPAGLDTLDRECQCELERLADALMEDIRRNANRKECSYKKTGRVMYDEFFPRLSKGIIDRIDDVLARHYGLSPEEQDFVVNFDAKHRMSTDGINHAGQ